jgi:hypothetical protein
VSDDIFDRVNLARRDVVIEKQKLRIEALEEMLLAVVEDYDWVQGGPGDRDWNVLDNTIIAARKVLFERDQWPKAARHMTDVQDFLATVDKETEQ